MFEILWVIHMVYTFVKALSYDLVVLILTWIRVSKSTLIATLRSQGLWYFIMTFVVTLPAAVRILLRALPYVIIRLQLLLFI